MWARPSEAAGVFAVLDLLNVGVWLVDSGAQVLHANARGKALAIRGNGLWIEQSGLPETDTPAQTIALRRLIARVATGRPVQGELKRSGGGR